MKDMSQATLVGDRELAISRLLDAPRELVWSVWTDPAHIGEWWGPNGFRTTTEIMELRPGGQWRFVMHGPDGRDYRNRIVYLEVVRPERLVYEHAGEDGDEPVNFRVTVTFAEEAGKTRLTMRMVFPSPDERTRVVEEYGAADGLTQTIGRLEEYLRRR